MVFDDLNLTPSTEGHFEMFEEKKMKSTGLLRNFLMYCCDTENFPLLLTLIDHKDPNLELYCRMLYCVAKKLNAVARVYQFKDFPIGDSVKEHL